MTEYHPKRERGRPSQGRTEYLEVRLSEAEKAAFEQSASATGVSLSDWVRLRLRASTAAEGHPVAHSITGMDVAEKRVSKAKRK